MVLIVQIKVISLNFPFFVVMVKISKTILDGTV